LRQQPCRFGGWLDGRPCREGASISTLLGIGRRTDT
jgi:hypothetical protein